MARARNIKPGFFTNDELAEVNPLGRLLFIGLWTIADREGRLEDRPRRIKAEALPYDDVDCDNLLDDLAKNGFILRYSVAGERYIQVLNFNKHQNPHIKESASEIPEPDLTGASTVQAPDEPDENPADTGYRIPDTGYPQPKPRKRDSSAKPTGEVDARFAAFWQSYPRKVGKPKAQSAFKRIDWREVEFRVLMESLEKQKQSEQWTKDGGKFIPHPTTWINRAGWNDELPGSSPPPGPQNQTRDPDEAEAKLQRDLADLRRKAGWTDNVTHLRNEGIA